MKSKLLIISFLGLSKMLLAQDSLRVTTVVDTFTPPQYVSNYDAFFLKQQPMKTMWKLASNAFIRDYGFYSSEITIAPEFRLAQGISLNMAFAFKTNTVFGEQPKPKSTYNVPIQLYLEPRFYLYKKKEMAQGESADNLIGVYTGIRTGVNVGPAIKGETYFGEAVVGSQQLFYLKTMRGLYKNFVDFSVGLGAAYNTVEKWKPSFHFQVLYGGLFENLINPRKNEKIPAICDVFQCFVEEKRLFKIDLMNLMTIADADNLDGGLDIEYEEKIKKSVFSVTVGANVRGYKFLKGRSKVEGLTLKTYVEPRWYYRMKKDIADGSSANNLSGFFGALQFGFQHNAYRATTLSDVQKTDYFYTHLIWGQQQRLLKFLFFEGKFGLGWKSPKTIAYQLLGNSHASLLAEVKIGLAF
jgi:hypothetical protein